MEDTLDSFNTENTSESDLSMDIVTTEEGNLFLNSNLHANLAGIPSQSPSSAIIEEDSTVQQKTQSGNNAPIENFREIVLEDGTAALIDKDIWQKLVGKIGIDESGKEKQLIFTCPEPECDQAFAKNCSLKSHMRIHRGEKPFGCTVCSRHFKTTVDLQKHVRIHLENNGMESTDTTDTTTSDTITTPVSPIITGITTSSTSQTNTETTSTSTPSCTTTGTPAQTVWLSRKEFRREYYEIVKEKRLQGGRGGQRGGPQGRGRWQRGRWQGSGRWHDQRNPENNEMDTTATTVTTTSSSPPTNTPTTSTSTPSCTTTSTPTQTVWLSRKEYRRNRRRGKTEKSLQGGRSEQRGGPQLRGVWQRGAQCHLENNEMDTTGITDTTTSATITMPVSPINTVITTSSTSQTNTATTSTSTSSCTTTDTPSQAVWLSRKEYREAYYELVKENRLQGGISKQQGGPQLRGGWHRGGQRHPEHNQMDTTATTVTTTSSSPPTNTPTTSTSTPSCTTTSTPAQTVWLSRKEYRRSRRRGKTEKSLQGGRSELWAGARGRGRWQRGNQRERDTIN